MLSAEDDAEQQAQEQQQKSGRSAWRDRLKDKANKLTKQKSSAAQQHQEVADFLRPSSSASSEPKPNPAPPRIDTATQWSSSVAPEDRIEPLAFPVPQAIRKRWPKPPGLHISFTEKEPDIIGEGGDECELPANQVVGSWMPHPDHLSRPAVRDHSRGRGQEPPEALKIGSEDASSQSALRRAPTRAARASDGWQQKRLSMSMEEGLVQAKKEELPDLGAPRLPEPTIPNLDFDWSSSVQPMKEKPYIAATIDPSVPQTTSPANEADSKSSGFLAYNPSIRRKSGDSRPADVHPAVMSDLPRSIAAEPEDLPDFGAAPSSIYSPEDAALHGAQEDFDHEARLAAFDVSQISPENGQFDDRPQLSDPTLSSPEFEAAEDFFTRMQHMRGTFKLTAARPRKTLSGEAAQWLRASTWWFLKGKAELEESLRAAQALGRPSSRGGDGLPQNKQCYIDLTKSWWVLRDVLPDIMQSDAASNDDPADGLDAQQLLDIFERTRWEVSRFLFSLQDKNLLPPPALLVQGADPEVWVPYPSLPIGLLALTATLNPRTLARYTPTLPHLAFAMPLGDSEIAFSYGRFFGLAQVLGDAELAKKGGLQCVVSVVRDQSATLAEFLVASQDGQINFHIQSDARKGPTYTDVRWTAQPNTLIIRLSAEVTVGIQLREPDFRFLYNVNDYNAKLEVERFANQDEELLYGDVVRAFHYMGPKEAKTGFPVVPVLACKVRLFQKSLRTGEGASARKAFAGYRLTVTSPSDGKTLSSITRHLTGQRPILFNNLKGQGDAPALALVFQEAAGKLASLIFTFASQPKRAAFHTILAGTATSPDECFSEDIPLASLAIADREQRPLPLPHGVQWQRLRVINAGSNLDEASCLLSDRLRVCISCNYGSLTDRVNLGSGELRIGLDPADTTALKLFRPAQNNLTLAFTEGAVRSAERQLLQDALAAANAAPSYRVYRFTSLPVLHDFQALVTGFGVLYDGIATAFSITRRRMVVPIHKHLETDHARLQVLKAHDGAVQLVAFFKSFEVGKCMGLQLKGTDVYESSARSGKFYVRFVEAKFAMPADDGSDLLCLDDPAFASEHDDLVFGFDGEDERDLFARALPASISKASRMASFRR